MDTSDGGGGSWASANVAIQSFTAAMLELGEVLDNVSEDQPSGLSSTRNILSNCTSSAIRGQWLPMKEAIEELILREIPAVLTQLTVAQHTQQVEVAAMQRGVEMLQHKAHAMIQHTESLMQQLLPELEVAAVRVNSMFD